MPQKQVSNPIREYLQIHPKGQGLLQICVSNPIREYLQIRELAEKGVTVHCFKPYKGVSSNKLFLFWQYLQRLRFKPYKGVSSNQQRNGAFICITKFQTL